MKKPRIDRIHHRLLAHSDMAKEEGTIWTQRAEHMTNWPRRTARSIYRQFLGWRFLQPAYELLHLISLEGMHMGAPADSVATSGERVVLRSLRHLLDTSSPLVICDVGANAGAYTAAILEDVAPPVQVWCFEPSSAAYATLEHRFGNRSEITLVPVALGEEEATVPLYSDAPVSGVASILPRQLEHRGIALKPSETVTVQRFDSVCHAHGITHIHLLKLDVEGYEMSVLRGVGDMMESNAIDAIQFEFGEGHITARTFLRDFYALLEPHYRLYRIVRDGLIPVDTYNAAYEVFTTTNYLALARRLA